MSRHISSRPTSTVSGSSRPGVAPYDGDLDLSRGSQQSTVTLGGVEYPVGSRIGKKGLFVIGDPDDSRTHSRSFDSSHPSLVNSQSPITRTTGEYEYKGFDFEFWNWSMIRFICFLFVCGIMVALLAATIGFSIEQTQNCETNFLWWEGPLFYNIPVPKFHDSDNDQVGDLKGMTKKLGYLDHIGVGAMILSDFLPAETKNWKRVTSYLDVDYRLGNLDDFRAMVDASHKDDIKVLLTFSIWCTSNEHRWFTESRESSAFGDTTFKAFFLWSDSPDEGGPGAWAFDEMRRQYYRHSNDSGCPILNWNNHKVHVAMEDVLDYWMDNGVDGFLLTDVDKLHVADDSMLLTVIDVLRQKLNMYTRLSDSKKVLVLEESFIDHLVRTDSSVRELIIPSADLIQTPLRLDPENKTLGLVGQLESGFHWQRREGGPWTLWTVTGLTGTDMSDIAALLYFTLSVPGTPSITAGQEIGMFFTELKDEDTKPMLWKASTIFPYLPGSVLDEAVITGVRNISKQRLGAYGLRLDHDPSDIQGQLNYKVIAAEEETLIFSRYYASRDMFFYIVNYDGDSVERNLVPFTAPWGEIIADSHSKLSGKAALDMITISSGQALLIKITK